MSTLAGNAMWLMSMLSDLSSPEDYSSVSLPADIDSSNIPPNGFYGDYLDVEIVSGDERNLVFDELSPEDESIQVYRLTSGTTFTNDTARSTTVQSVDQPPFTPGTFFPNKFPLYRWQLYDGVD